METRNWRAVRLFPPLDRRSLWLLGGPLAILFCRFFVFAALITKGGPAAWHWHPGVLAGIVIPMFNYNLFGRPLFEEFGWRGWPSEVALVVISFLAVALIATALSRGRLCARIGTNK